MAHTPKRHLLEVVSCTFLLRDAVCMSHMLHLTLRPIFHDADVLWKQILCLGTLSVATCTFCSFTVHGECFAHWGKGWDAS
jgi:hypothetical protein